MGVVVKFPLEQVSRASSIPANSPGAEVLLFEGVRYSQVKKNGVPSGRKETSKKETVLNS